MGADQTPNAVFACLAVLPMLADALAATPLAGVANSAVGAEVVARWRANAAVRPPLPVVAVRSSAAVSARVSITVVKAHAGAGTLAAAACLVTVRTDACSAAVAAEAESTAVNALRSLPHRFRHADACAAAMMGPAVYTNRVAGAAYATAAACPVGAQASAIRRFPRRRALQPVLEPPGGGATRVTIGTADHALGALAVVRAHLASAAIAAHRAAFAVHTGFCGANQ